MANFDKFSTASYSLLQLTDHVGPLLLTLVLACCMKLIFFYDQHVLPGIYQF